MSEIRYYAVIVFCLALILACKDKRPSQEQVVDETINSAQKFTDDQESTMKREKTIMFFGNSLTAGYGLEDGESFPSRIQELLDSLGYQYEVINAGLSGETTSGGKNRIDWVLREPVDIFVLELGANDVLRGLDLSETQKNLEDIVKIVQSKYPDTEIVIAGMEAPPNMGSEYTTQFRGIFSKLAKEHDAALIPFLLDNVAGIPSLNLGDGKHPNAEGQYIVRDNVWQVIKELVVKE